MNPIAKLKKMRLRAYIGIYRCLPIKRNKIILWADNFKHYGCSPKYITEYILKQYPGKYDLVWVFDHDVNVPLDLSSGIRVVRYFSLKYLRELHTARFIICNTRMGYAHMWHKRKEQKYIQTWHSSIRLKKIEGDASENLPQTYIEQAKSDSLRTDLIVSGCEFSTRIFKNAFWYDGPILQAGTPRCDIFFKGLCNEVRQKVHRILGIDPEMKILLYAPTFRHGFVPNLHGLDFSRIVEALNTRYGTNWQVLYRFHPNVRNDQSQGPGFGINVSSYPDIQELIAAADCLITDYSSCMFDMAIAHKPCFLFAPDLHAYLQTERKLYFDPRQLPFPLAENNDELIRAINDFAKDSYLLRVEKFLQEVGSHEDGKASDRVVKYIESII